MIWVQNSQKVLKFCWKKVILPEKFVVVRSGWLYGVQGQVWQWQVASIFPTMGSGRWWPMHNDRQMEVWTSNYGWQPTEFQNQCLWIVSPLHELCLDLSWTHQTIPLGDNFAGESLHCTILQWTSGKASQIIFCKMLFWLSRLSHFSHTCRLIGGLIFICEYKYCIKTAQYIN